MKFFDAYYWLYEGESQGVVKDGGGVVSGTQHQGACPWLNTAHEMCYCSSMKQQIYTGMVK